jgi:hypothetical protein
MRNGMRIKRTAEQMGILEIGTCLRECTMEYVANVASGL